MARRIIISSALAVVKRLRRVPHFIPIHGKGVSPPACYLHPSRLRVMLADEHNSLDFPPLTYSGLLRTPLLTTIECILVTD